MLGGRTVANIKKAMFAIILPPNIFCLGIPGNGQKWGT
jgi:di/tricarboxylate transporter